jgi:hypothetical protein
MVSNDQVNIDSNDGKMLAAREIIEAINNKDAKALLMAVESLIQMIEMEPHDESSK